MKSTIQQSETSAQSNRPITAPQKSMEASSATTENINFRTQENLMRNEFSGFVSVADLLNDRSMIPRVKGVYMVVRQTNAAPIFLEKGSGGFYQGKDPNVSIDKLHKNWVDDTCVVYIGQTGGNRKGQPSSGTLSERIETYIRFGQGENIGHRGGRCIWQLTDASDLLFCWKELPNDDPRKVEKELIGTFKRQHCGKRPFANLRD